MEWYIIALIAYPLFLAHQKWVRPYLRKPADSYKEQLPLEAYRDKPTTPINRTVTELPAFILAEWERPVKAKDYIDYKDYITSDAWQKSERRLNCIKAARNKCQMCSAMFGLEVHHISYANLGKELPQELVLLCALCHDHTHKMAGKGAKYYPPLRRPKLNKDIT